MKHKQIAFMALGVCVAAGCSHPSNEKPASGAQRQGSLLGPSSIVGVYEYHWEIRSQKGEHAATRTQVSFPEKTDCTVNTQIYAGEPFRDGGPTSELQLATYIWDSNNAGAPFFAKVEGTGSAEEYAYADAVGYYTMRRVGGTELELTTYGKLTGYFGQIVIEEFTIGYSYAGIPIRRGSIKCNSPFNVDSIAYGNEVVFVDVINAAGTAAGNSTAGAAIVEADVGLVSPLSGVAVGTGSPGMATVQYESEAPVVHVSAVAGAAANLSPDGVAPATTIFVREGPGSYKVDIDSSEQGSDFWYVVGYGMDRLLDLNSIQVGSDPIEHPTHYE